MQDIFTTTVLASSEDANGQDAMQGKREVGETDGAETSGLCKTCPANAVCPVDGSMLDSLYQRRSWQPAIFHD